MAMRSIPLPQVEGLSHKAEKYDELQLENATLDGTELA